MNTELSKPLWCTANHSGNKTLHQTAGGWLECAGCGQLYRNDAMPDKPVVDYSDQRAVLGTKPLRGLRPVHECGGLYVIVRECPHAPDNYEIIAENLTAEHARQICDCVNGRNGM